MKLIHERNLNNMFNNILKPRLFYLLIVFLLFINTANSADQTSGLSSFKNKISSAFKPQSDDAFKTLELQKLSNFTYIPMDQMEQIPSAAQINTLDFFQAIQHVLQRNPQVAQTLAMLSAQNANIAVAQAQYYPQLSGGISTGDLDSTTRNRQMLNLTATQMLFDFGKVKTSVVTQKEKLQLEQAKVLIGIDDIAYQTCNAIINIERYRINLRIAQQQVAGIEKILEIAQLRARAGISSQADPVQAESYLQSAQSNLIMQQSMLQQFQQRLNILLGFDATEKRWQIPEQIISASALYTDPEFNHIPQIIAAQREVDIAKSDKKQIDLSRYPTVSLKGSLSQAINGVHPNNNDRNGFDSGLMIEARSDFYQGGATSARNRAASYAEQAAKAKVNAVYLDIMDQIRVTRETIENKQKQITVLVNRQNSTVMTKALYQEQYKLGTRTVLDLLNAEMAIHSANSELENARYDIYSSLAQFIAVTGRTRQAYNLNNISIQGFEVQP